MLNENFITWPECIWLPGSKIKILLVLDYKGNLTFKNSTIVALVC